MNLEGMDVDQVGGLARRIDTYTQSLNGVAGALGGLAAELSHLWLGPAASTFQQDCETRYRPAITAAAGALSDMHRHLTANLAQQVRASAADGAGAGGPAGGIGAAGVTPFGVAGALGVATWEAVTTVNQYSKLAAWPFNKAKEIAGIPDTPGSGHGVWSWMKKEEGKDLFPYYKDSKVVGWLKETPEVGRVARFMEETHAYRLLEQAPAVGLVIAGVSVGVDLGEAYYDHSQGRDGAAASDLVNAAADGVGAIPVVGWLGSFDIEMAKADVNEIVTGDPAPKGEVLNIALGGHG